MRGGKVYDIGMTLNLQNETNKNHEDKEEKKKEQRTLRITRKKVSILPLANPLGGAV
jgi:hypothetical protein